jgi:hypothetical protein
VIRLTYGLGDSFSAGDVLLEVETDKAQMDVEAQDDGKMAKIMVQCKHLPWTNIMLIPDSLATEAKV